MLGPAHSECVYVRERAPYYTSNKHTSNFTSPITVSSYQNRRLCISSRFFVAFWNIIRLCLLLIKHNLRHTRYQTAKNPTFVPPESSDIQLQATSNIVLGKWPTWRTILFYVFISIFYMFRATSFSSSGESIVSIQHLLYVTLCRWPFRVHVGKLLPDLHTKWSPIQSDI